MKYSLPNRISAKMLRKADEIKVDYKDKERMFEYIDQYPDKEFVLTIPAAELPDFTKLLAYAEKTNGNFTCELENITKYKDFQEQGLKYYWKYPVTNFYEFQGLKDIGVSQILIDAPIFFKMKDVKSFNIPIRVIPNVAYDNYIPRESGVHGSWIRPQDIHIYEPYVSTLEFKTDHLSQIETLYNIYAEKGKWIDNMKYLITNFETSVLATGFTDDVIKTRLNCGQRCTQNRCHLCESAIILANKLTQNYINEVNNRS